MGDAEACHGAASAEFSEYVTASLTQNGSAKKKENGYAKRFYNGNNFEEQVCHIFGFPRYKKHGGIQPDIFISEKGKSFVGEVKSIKDDRVVVWVNQYEKYKELAQSKNGERNNFFYFFAKYNGYDKPVMTDIFIVGYKDMKILMEKEKIITRFGLKKKYCKKIDCMEEGGQVLIDDEGGILSCYKKDGNEKLEAENKINKIVGRNRKDIIGECNRKGPYIRIGVSELSDCCPDSKVISDNKRRKSIVIHYENKNMDFAYNTRYPPIKKKKTPKLKNLSDFFSSN